jgi:DNA-binding response OmpR family regulator
MADMLLADDLKLRPTPLAGQTAARSQPSDRRIRHAAGKECPVLIVEDDADLREMMAQLLTLEGFAAATASNGREALTYLRTNAAPDVILLDLMMPVMDGWEFRREQQRDREMAGVPVIILSALDQPRGADLAGDAFLKKPLDFDRLLELIRRYCG